MNQPLLKIGLLLFFSGNLIAAVHDSETKKEEAAYVTTQFYAKLSDTEKSVLNHLVDYHHDAELSMAVKAINAFEKMLTSCDQEDKRTTLAERLSFLCKVVLERVRSTIGDRASHGTFVTQILNCCTPRDAYFREVVAQNLIVTESITGNIAVSGNESIAGNLLVGGTLTVEGASTLSALTVTGATTLNDATMNQATVNGNLLLPHSNSAATEGIIKLGAVNFISNVGVANVFIGGLSATVTGGGNTVVGFGAFTSATSGDDNTAIGYAALDSNTSGRNNIAVGVQALESNSSGTNNIAIGVQALAANTTTGDNVAIGGRALEINNGGASNLTVGNASLLVNTTGSSNVVVGNLALSNSASGSNNVAMGNASGLAYTGAESNNIIISSAGTLGDNNTTRIGTQGTGTGQQNRCFIAGIFGSTVGGSGIAVFVDSDGQLGTVVSSRRYKENIKDMEEASNPVLLLQPVTFTYKTDETKQRQFGLIAEDVYKIFPDLVVCNKDGLPETVRYHNLAVLLLNELKKQNETIEKLMHELRSRRVIE